MVEGRSTGNWTIRLGERYAFF